LVYISVLPWILFIDASNYVLRLIFAPKNKIKNKKNKIKNKKNKKNEKKPSEENLFSQKDKQDI